VLAPDSPPAFMEDNPTARHDAFVNPRDNETEKLAIEYFHTMNEHLQFNICDLDTSHMRNQDIQDLSARIEKNIPNHVLYACRHFTDDLVVIIFEDSSPALRIEVERFLREKLLFWLEVLSLLGEVDRGYDSMFELSQYIQVRKHRIFWSIMHQYL
jgi:hypothetical protein